MFMAINDNLSLSFVSTKMAKMFMQARMTQEAGLVGWLKVVELNTQARMCTNKKEKKTKLTPNNFRNLRRMSFNDEIIQKVGQASLEFFVL